MDNIRVFISYSHEDGSLVDQLVSTLEQNGITVLWSKKLTVGTGFDEQLKVFIEHAHVFMPVITGSSSSRGWVHQEIGYAMALHIPVFPVTIGDEIPGGLLHSIHAMKLSNNENELKEQLSYYTYYNMLQKVPLPALYQRAAMVEERAAMMRLYADKVCILGKHGTVRQMGGLSSFHIPDKRIGHPVWEDRYYPEKRSNHHKELQLGERKSLQQHAVKEGCKLIINPEYAITGRSKLAATTRLITLIEFLESIPNEKAVIAFQNGTSRKESLTMVGDWFLAESVSFKDGDGYTNTFFTRNALEIAKRIQTFDEELEYLLDQQGWTTENSREKAIEELNRILLSLKD